MTLQEKAAKVLDTPEAAYQEQRNDTVPAEGATRNPSPAEFTRVQAVFAKRGRTLHRVRRLASVRVSYQVNEIGRSDAQHFGTWQAVLEDLVKIGGN